jgi:hypothetical protein
MNARNKGGLVCRRDDIVDRDGRSWVGNHSNWGYWHSGSHLDEK